MGGVRMARLNSLITETVAEVIQRKSKDPRLSQVAITRAEVAPNLQSAKVFYGILDGGDDVRAAAAKALEKARGFVRSALYESLSMRRIPEIRFEPDRNVGHAARIGEVLASIMRDDASGAGGAGGSREEDSREEVLQ